MKILRAFSLPTVIVVSILISLLALFAISLFSFNNLYYSHYHRMKQRKEDLNSMFVLYANDSTLQRMARNQEAYQLYEDDPQTSFVLKSKRWGLYECVEIRATDGHSSSIRLLGEAQEGEYEAALWSGSIGSPLTLAGKSEVKGKTYVPVQGIRYADQGELSFQGKEVAEHSIHLAGKELPEVDLPNLYLMEQFLKETQVLPSASDNRYLSYHSFSADEVHYYVPDDVEQLCVRGNVVLHAEEIEISAESLLRDVILVARRVMIEEGFRGSLQIIATDTVILGRNSHLHYPSGIYLKGNSDKTYLKMGENSTLSGYGVVFGTTETEAGSYGEENFSQASDAEFNGLLYVDGIAHLQGTCYGGVYLKECHYISGDKRYSNTLCNARIYRNSTVGFPSFFKQSTYRRRELKTLY